MNNIYLQFTINGYLKAWQWEWWIICLSHSMPGKTQEKSLQFFPPQLSWIFSPLLETDNWNKCINRIQLSMATETTWTKACDHFISHFIKASHDRVTDYMLQVSGGIRQAPRIPIHLPMISLIISCQMCQ